jgi:hypothetical protein
MRGRDRMVLIGVIVLVVVAAGWMLFVSPERQKVKTLAAQITASQASLATAEGELSSARADQAQYSKAYAAVVSLGKAVPASQEVPSLIFQLAQATHQHNVDFNSIVSGGGAGSSSSASAAAGAVASAGFTQMPFTFIFNGSFFDLEHLFRSMTAFATHNSTGGLEVDGRLLTIQSVKLAPEAAATTTSGKPGKQILTGTITASAYVLPASQGLTAGATAASPTGASTPAATSSSSTATTPAIARVTP